ncbi:MAG: hypothetical protein ACMUIA_08350, partial [bacterium]
MDLEKPQNAPFLDDEILLDKNKKELIRIIRHLSAENEKCRGIIQYQQEENQNFIRRILKAQPEGNAPSEDMADQATLLPFLEAIEQTPDYGETGRLRRLLSDAFLNKDSKYYRTVNNTLVILILFSVACVTLESVPSLMERWSTFFHWSELIVVGLFTIEYVVNIYVAEDKLGYIFGIWG